MATPTDRTFQVAADCLDEVVSGLEAGNGAPERRYVNDGALVAWDCEQVVVGVESVYGHQGDLQEAQSQENCLVMRAAVMTIWVIRCSPTLDDSAEPPTPAEIEASARVVLSDPLAVTNALSDAYRQGRITGARGMAFLDTNTVGPDGGLVGTVTRVRIDLTTAVV